MPPSGSLTDLRSRWDYCALYYNTSCSSGNALVSGHTDACQCGLLQMLGHGKLLCSRLSPSAAYEGSGRTEQEGIAKGQLIVVMIC